MLGEKAREAFSLVHAYMKQNPGSPVSKAILDTGASDCNYHSALSILKKKDQTAYREHMLLRGVSEEKIAKRLVGKQKRQYNWQKPRKKAVLDIPVPALNDQDDGKTALAVVSQEKQTGVVDANRNLIVIMGQPAEVGAVLQKVFKWF